MTVTVFFFLHTTPEEFENGHFTLHASNLFLPRYSGEI